MVCNLWASGWRRKRAIAQNSSLKAHPSQGKHAAGNPEEFDSDDEHTKLRWHKSQRLINKYLALKVVGSGGADKFLSSVLKPKENITIELIDQTSHLTCDWVRSLDLVRQDLVERTLEATPSNTVVRDKCAHRVAEIRRSSARSASTDSSSSLKYSMPELVQVLNGLNMGSRCLRGCYAALRVRLQGARLLILAIVNLCVALQVAPSSTFLRVFFLLRKKVLRRFW